MANSSYEYDTEDEILDVSFERPHLVILGAGASIAACPTGDANGKQLPSMLNLVETIELEEILQSSGLPTTGNFEDIYSSIAADSQFDSTRKALEDKIRDYFAALVLPDSPTIYDHLVLSLREKDTIATFNWDPFLCQALHRNKNKAPLPRALFLHGNVSTSVCTNDRRAYYSHGICTSCGEPTEPTKLLYPVTNKNYIEDPFINSQWNILRNRLSSAYLLTVYGYGAPKSDVEAVDLMASAWNSDGKGQHANREFEQTEIINILPKDQLVETWDPFIYSHHYRIFDNFYESWLAKHPRRSCEAEWQQSMEAKFVSENPIPTQLAFNELWNWMSRLTEHEVKRN